MNQNCSKCFCHNYYYFIIINSFLPNYLSGCMLFKRLYCLCSCRPTVNAITSQHNGIESSTETLNRLDILYYHNVITEYYDTVTFCLF